MIIQRKDDYIDGMDQNVSSIASRSVTKIVYYPTYTLNLA